MTGVLLAVPPADFVLHNSLFPGGALPQRDHQRRAVRGLRRLQLLVPQGLRLHACTRGGARLAFWFWTLAGFIHHVRPPLLCWGWRA